MEEIGYNSSNFICASMIGRVIIVLYVQASREGESRPESIMKRIHEMVF